MIAKLVLAVVIAVVVGIVLTALLGPILISINVPIAEVVGRFFKDWGFVIGLLCGIWYYFTGGGFTFPGRSA